MKSEYKENELEDKKRKEDSDWLKEKLAEYEMTQGQLADKINEKPYKISKWINCNASMNKEDKEKIINFFQNGTFTSYNGYKKMKSKDFSNLLNRLLEEFKNEITQAELGKRINVSQKTISTYQNKTSGSIDVETQYNILREFYYLCLGDSGRPVSSHTSSLYEIASYGIDDARLFITGRELVERELLNPDDIADYSDDMLICFESSNPYSDDVEEFSKYCIEVERIVVEHFDIFCSEYICERNYVTCMDMFRKLSLNFQKSVISKLEASVPCEFHDEAFNLDAFDLHTSYREMIKMLKQNPDCFKVLFKNENENDKKKIKTCIEFEKKCLGINEDEYSKEGDIIDAIKYKFSFSAREWYVWLLFMMSDMDSDDILKIIKKHTFRYFL